MSTPAPFGRIAITQVEPLVRGGASPIKAVTNEDFTLSATVFCDGHRPVGARIRATDADGGQWTFPMTESDPGLNRFSATIALPKTGWYELTIEAWVNAWAAWVHDARIKIPAGIDAELMLAEGATLAHEAATDGMRPAGERECLAALAADLGDRQPSPQQQWQAALAHPAMSLLSSNPIRRHLTQRADIPVLVERERALFGSWYEIFVRSEGAAWSKDQGWRSGTFASATQRLPAIAQMGFDVVYLTPIHPIGQTARKGANDSLVAQPGEPGSPYAIGSSAGGHDAIHPDLGTFADFDRFVAAAAANGLEVALDLALQCSPDHPWVRTHPQFFTHRADGSIAFAENPPKKYEDIYPLNFDNDPEGIFTEIRRVIQVWLDHGIRIFRVDNPHTKPLDFWRRLISDVASDYPETVWLSEAFTKPPIMRALMEAGFQQSYTYFTWRTTGPQVREYAQQLAEEGHFFRPALWPTTPDILTPYLQRPDPVAWRIRAALAALISPTWGIYTGYELIEWEARADVEEQLNSEKYQYRPRPWGSYQPQGPEPSLAGWLSTLNSIRRDHPALHWMRNLRLHASEHDQVIAFSKSRQLPGGEIDTVLVLSACEPTALGPIPVVWDQAAPGMSRARDLVDAVTGESIPFAPQMSIELSAQAPARVFIVRGE